MASLKDLINGVRNNFSHTPSRDDLIKLVEEDKLDELKAAFYRRDLDTTNLLHSVRSPDMVDFLVEKGADVNQPFDWGPIGDDEYPHCPSPLMRAAAGANVETVQRLLHHGADPDSGGVMDRGPLGAALDRSDDQQEPMVRALLDAGANTHTELAYAVKKEVSIGLITSFLEHGANPDDHTNGDGVEPALNIAVAQGRGEVVDLLLDYGADPMARNVIYETSLHYAVSSDQTPMVEKLVGRSADPAGLLNATADGGNTALTQAAFYGHLESTCKLLELGADPGLAIKGHLWDSDPEISGIDGDKVGRKEAMNLVRVQAEKAVLRQSLAEVEQDTSPEVAEQPVARRRARL